MGPDEDFWQLLRRGGGPYREGLMCASTAIGVELLAQTVACRQDGTLHRWSNYRDVLKRAMKELLELASERIKQQAETSIKGHLFFSMILAHTEAIEEDANQHLRILRCAKDSLEHCHGLLQAQVDTATMSYPHDVDFMAIAPEAGVEDLDLDLDLDWGFDFSLPS